MIVQSRDWLPNSVIMDDVVRDAIRSAIAQWSARWFVGEQLVLSGLKASSGAARNESDESGWRICRTAIAIRGDRSALSHLIYLALDTHTEDTHLTEGDQALLQGLERRILDDLAETLEQAFDLAGELKLKPQKVWDPLCEGGGLLASLVETSGREILSFALPAHVIVPRIKAHLGPAAQKTEDLQPLTKALGDVSVSIEALIGSAELTLAEFNDLAVGDVLILDRTLDQPVDITGAGSGQAFAKATLTHVDDDMALVFK